MPFEDDFEPVLAIPNGLADRPCSWEEHGRGVPMGDPLRFQGDALKSWRSRGIPSKEAGMTWLVVDPPEAMNSLAERRVCALVSTEVRREGFDFRGESAPGCTKRDEVPP